MRVAHVEVLSHKRKAPQRPFLFSLGICALLFAVLGVSELAKAIAKAIGAASARPRVADRQAVAASDNLAG